MKKHESKPTPKKHGKTTSRNQSKHVGAQDFHRQGPDKLSIFPHGHPFDSSALRDQTSQHILVRWWSELDFGQFRLRFKRVGQTRPSLQHGWVPGSLVHSLPALGLNQVFALNVKTGQPQNGHKVHLPRGGTQEPTHGGGTPLPRGRTQQPKDPSYIGSAAGVGPGPANAK